MSLGSGWMLPSARRGLLADVGVAVFLQDFEERIDRIVHVVGVDHAAQADLVDRQRSLLRVTGTEHLDVLGHLVGARRQIGARILLLALGITARGQRQAAEHYSAAGKEILHGR